MILTISDNESTPLILRTLKEKNAIGWCLADIDGWFETPSIREGVLDHPSIDGGIWPNSYTQSPRILTIYGIAKTNSNLETSSLEDQINGFLGKSLDIVGEDFNGKRETSGYISDKPYFTHHAYKSLIEFTLIITCPDPHKYSPAITYRASNNRITVLNLGNCDTWPVLRAGGSVTSLTATLNGHTISWSGSTSNLVIDFRRGTCSSGTLSVDDAFPIPPGEHDVSITTNSGVSVSMEVKSAWR